METGKWDDLRFVLAVAEAGSVNAAASRLKVNHATVLRRVASFEQMHETTIFIRNARGYTVAPDAIGVINAIREVQRSIDTLERVVSGKGERLDGIIRMTSTDSLCLTVLPPLIRAFHNAHPGLTVELHSTNSHLNLSKLDAEITIRPAKKLPADLEGRDAARMDFGVYGSASYLLSNPSPNRENHRWLGITDLLKGSPVGQWQLGLPKENLVFLADSFVTLAEVAQMGVGLAMLPSFLADATEGLVRASNVPDRLDTSIWVACHHDLKATPRIAVCVDFFANGLAASKSFQG